MSNWLKLEGDVCAVTGALGGMGVEICREFARNGANVVLLDLDEEKVKAAAVEPPAPTRRSRWTARGAARALKRGFSK